MISCNMKNTLAEDSVTVTASTISNATVNSVVQAASTECSLEAQDTRVRRFEGTKTEEGPVHHW